MSIQRAFDIANDVADLLPSDVKGRVLLIHLLTLRAAEGDVAALEVDSYEAPATKGVFAAYHADPVRAVRFVWAHGESMG